MNLFNRALNRSLETGDRPPVWFMRQAGRYHSHYQALRAKHSFMDLCKVPAVACEATMGPVQDFGFDAAILFSDLLFPLEAMGMGLRYDEGPKLDWHLRAAGDLARLRQGTPEHMAFQGEAMKMIRERLPADKGLLGFVGGPLTLYCYAVEGSHAGQFESAHEGFADGRYDGFCERLVDLLAQNMAIQARNGADTVAILDTCAGEFDPGLYRERIIPALRVLIERFHSVCPDTPVVYYSKKTGPDHWRSFRGLGIAGMGVDWNYDISQVLRDWGGEFAVQGNIDPSWLFLEGSDLEGRLRAVFEKVKAVPLAQRRGWICGLGHGVLPKTPESNVRLFLRLQREIFGSTDE